MKPETKVKIVCLEPMRMASFRAIDREPEKKAFEMMSSWAQENNALDEGKTRFFGFDNPAPTAAEAEYGYEVWMTTKADAKASAEVRTIEFPGGLYAVQRTGLPRIAQSWKDLIDWRENSHYGAGTHQCLEEHLVLPIGNPPEAVEINLYLPLAE